ncbi:MAG TPA: hypothetical protein VI547_13875 [Anaerolineales bacterium]|nr:hypothetical protein [Anaerolineales bacterium]
MIRTGGNRAGLQQLSFPVIGGGYVAQEIAADLSALQSNVTELQSKASLTDLQADVTQLDQQLSKLAQTLETVRKQGYAYAGDIDTKLYDVMSQWQTVKPQVDNAIYQQGTALYNSAYALHGPLSQLAAYQGNAGQARGLLPSLQSQVSSLLSNASSVESNIRSMYSSLDSEASTLESRLWRIENTMKVVSAAKFRLAEGESAVMAVKAKWDKDGKDDPEGNLFLTDKRLIFEQKQEIVKKKVLFIATEKEMVQEVLIDAPLAKVTGAKASKKGLLGHEDHLDVDYDGKSAHFHIDGQDSNEWQALIEKAKSGGLEAERAAASAGVSIADMTGPITQADIVALQSEVNDLQSRAMLTFAKDALEDMEGKVSNLPRQLSDVRARGYAFEKALESQVQSLGEQWGRIKQTVNDDVRQQSASLNQTMQGIQAQMAQVMAQSANPNAARPAFMQVKSMAASAEAQAAAAEGAIYGQYDDFQASVESLSAHLDWVGWMLEALASASFTLLATEGGVAAAEVNWLRPNSDPMGGVLFLTDQRIIFEEREGEFSVPLEAPLAQVQSADAESGQGAGGDEEHLKIIFAPGAPASYGLFHLVGPKAEDWKTQIGRATKGDYTSDRAVAIDQAAVDKVKSAPTQCPNCSAAFTKPVLRGQTEITCEFCGAVTRL